MRIQYGKHTIPCKVEYGTRKSIAISVRPDHKIIVRAPQGGRKEDIIKVVRKRAGWIIKQQQFFSRFHPLPPVRRFQNGETHYYLGRQYRIKVNRNNAKIQYVRLKGKYIHIGYPDKKNREKIQSLLNMWYADKARGIISARAGHFWPFVHSGGPKAPQIQVRKMTKSWGSFSKGKRLTFNLELVKAPKYCLDYVVVHELCHLVHPKHDQGFYRLVRRILPDWERRKEKLEKVVI